MIEHPQIIHFPIALLLSALLSELLTYLGHRDFWDRVTIFLLGLGVVSAIIAVITGNFAAEAVKQGAGIVHLVAQHRQAGLWVLGLFSFVFIAKGLFMYFKVSPVQVRLLITLFMLLGALQIYQAGHFGGKLVYRHGVGVQQQK